MKRRYRGSKVEIKVDPNGDGWMAFFVNGKPIAWFLELTDACAC
jgi:hypothetical protein